MTNLQRSVAALLAGAARIEREEATLRRAIETGRLPSMANSISGSIPAQALVMIFDFFCFRFTYCFVDVRRLVVLLN